MKTHLAIAASIIALAAAAPALAGSHDAHDHAFPLSMEDFIAAYPDTTPEEFAVIDSDGDGMVSEAEYEEARETGLIDDDHEGDDEGEDEDDSED